MKCKRRPSICMILRAKDLDMKMNDLSSIKGHKEMKDLNDAQVSTKCLIYYLIFSFEQLPLKQQADEVCIRWHKIFGIHFQFPNLDIGWCLNMSLNYYWCGFVDISLFPNYADAHEKWLGNSNLRIQTVFLNQTFVVLLLLTIMNWLWL